ncbi:auxin response factor 2A-like [Cryptomeria japonica]|uniref:auxin response factor 2A-like n=1 Tax=Cryptomeria japonica TaxID=3369 RepID=UPI0025AD917B|nr:auxin response factor 2A-like [Cryptomeria japonica]
MKLSRKPFQKLNESNRKQYLTSTAPSPQTSGNGSIGKMENAYDAVPFRSFRGTWWCGQRFNEKRKHNLGNDYKKYSAELRGGAVHKQGSALGRAVDLTKFEGYKELTHELEVMFNFERELEDPSKGCQLVYIDDEGDMMLVGDDPRQ